MLLAPNWLGDAVMFSALLEFLHEHRNLSDGRKLVFHLAVREAWAPLFKNDNRLESILVVHRGGRHSGILGGWKLGNEIRFHKPDAVVLGPPSFRAGIAAWRSGAPIRVGYKSDGRGLLLTLGIETPVRGSRHHSLELIDLGRALLAELGQHLTASESHSFLPTLPGCVAIQPEASSSPLPIWIFAPGATYGSAKSWPLNNALGFVKTAIMDRGVQLVLLGDAAAKDFARGLADGLDMPLSEKFEGTAGLVDLTGQTDLKQVVSIMKASQVFVGNDSGLMHLAGALGMPTVGLFGSSNPDWTSPVGPRCRAVAAEGFSCRPCYLKNCNQKEFCLDTINASRVLSAVDDVLSLNS